MLDAPRKVYRHKWPFGRQTAVRTTLVAAVWGIVLRRPRNFDTMLPLNGTSIEVQRIEDRHLSAL
jgi:hypothetical protein